MQSGIHLPKLTKANKILIVVVGSLFILDTILGGMLGQTFGLSSGRFFSGHLYSLVTYPLISQGLFDALFNCLLLWFLGSEFENMWGVKRYLAFLLTSTLGAGVIYLLITGLLIQGSFLYSFPLTGLNGAAAALCLAYAIIYPDRIFTFMLIFPMRAKYFCMILIGMSLFNGFFSPGKALAWGHLGAMAFGYLFMLVVSSPRYKSYFETSKLSPKPKPKRKGRAKLSIVEDDSENKDGDTPKYWQ